MISLLILIRKDTGLIATLSPFIFLLSAFPYSKNYKLCANKNVFHFLLYYY